MKFPSVGRNLAAGIAENPHMACRQPRRQLFRCDAPTASDGITRSVAPVPFPASFFGVVLRQFDAVVRQQQ